MVIECLKAGKNMGEQMAKRPTLKKPAKSSAGARARTAKAHKSRKRIGAVAAGGKKPAKASSIKKTIIRPKKKPNPAFLKPGQSGSRPAPVVKWVEDLGATVPYNRSFIIDPRGKERDPKKITKFCGETFYVVYNAEEATAKPCAGLNFQPFVARAEAAPQKTADELIAKCEEDGCRGGSQVVYELWICSGTAKGSAVNVQIVIKVECIEI
jgi:hypothetical protein